MLRMRLKAAIDRNPPTTASMKKLRIVDLDMAISYDVRYCSLLGRPALLAKSETRAQKLRRHGRDRRRYFVLRTVIWASPLLPSQFATIGSIPQMPITGKFR